MSIHIPTPHVAEVSVLWTDPLGDTKCESTFYVEDNSDAIFEDAPGFATQVWDAWVAQVVPHLSSLVHSNGVIFEDQRVLPYVGAVYPKPDTPGGMGLTGTQLPAGTSIAIKRGTTALGRSGRGRLYLPIWDSAILVNGNAIGAGSAAVYTSALAAFQTAVEGGTHPCLLGIVSKQTAGAPRAIGQFTQVNAWNVTDLTIDSQRRRLPGRGR